MTSKNRFIKRYSAAERINHWVVAVCFVMLALSGLALFYHSFSWLGNIFGTLKTAKIVHPFVGVIMFVGFARQFFRYVSRNIIDKEDVKWAFSVKKVLLGQQVGDIGKYNGGQKVMFWIMTICLMVMLVTGIMIWQPCCADNFSNYTRSIALLLHSWSALILIASIIIHVYAAFWIKGTIRAMTEGVVSERWAQEHHPRWYREVMSKQALIEKETKSDENRQIDTHG